MSNRIECYQFLREDPQALLQSIQDGLTTKERSFKLFETRAEMLQHLPPPEVWSESRD